MSDPRPILVLQCGNTFPDLAARLGDFDQWFLQVIQSCGAAGVVHDAHRDRDLPDPEGFCGFIVTGSPAMVTDRAPWSEALGRWLVARIREQRPVLGVCYGHQLIADALGGRVDYQSDGREIGSLWINLQAEAVDDPLFSGLDGGFHAHLTHMQSVFELPAEAIWLASSSRVRHQAYRVGNRAWGVQFHPEFSESIMDAYLGTYARDLPAALKTHVGPRPCPQARRVLERFIALCAAGGAQ